MYNLTIEDGSWVFEHGEDVLLSDDTQRGDLISIVNDSIKINESGAEPVIECKGRVICLLNANGEAAARLLLSKNVTYHFDGSNWNEGLVEVEAEDVPVPEVVVETPQPVESVAEVSPEPETEFDMTGTLSQIGNEYMLKLNQLSESKRLIESMESTLNEKTQLITDLQNQIADLTKSKEKLQAAVSALSADL